MVAAPKRYCVDCEAEWKRRGEGPPKTPRKAPYGGPRTPRCRSHDLQIRRRSKERNHDRYVQRTYGLVPGEFARLKAFQGGKCSLCRRATGATRELSVDHDHKCCPAPPTCGKCNRGLVCRPCNDLLGQIRDSQEFLYRAAAYLQDPPFRQFKRKEVEDGHIEGAAERAAPWG